MNQYSYFIDNISCGHCTQTIETELSTLAEVHSVSADKTSKIVTISTDGTGATIEALLVEIGFAGKRLNP